MRMKTLLEYAALLIVGVLAVASLVGVLLDRPVFVSYAYSGSMAPTIGKGDVFFINPLARSPGVGEIMVFRTGSVWTVHRVYAVTEDGYVTKGDNNVATDQQSHKIPPIPKDKVAGTVITVNGKPIKVPKIGNYLEGGLSGRTRVLLAGGLIVLGILSFAGDGGSKGHKKRKRETVLRFKTLYLLASILLLIMVAVSTFVSWEALPVTYSSTSAGGLREGWYLPGEEFRQNVTVRNDNRYPMMYRTSAGPTITDVSSGGFKLGGGEEKDLVLTIRAPNATGLYSPKLQVNAYPPLLPAPILVYLYEIHPMVPLMAILAEISVLLGALYVISGVGNEEVIRIRRRRGSFLSGISEVFRI